MADNNATKLQFALRLNNLPGEGNNDPHAQFSDAKAIQKKKKVYQNLEEDLEPVTLDSPMAKSTSYKITTNTNQTPAPQPPPPASEASHSAEETTQHAQHEEEHEIIHPIEAVLITDLDKTPEASAEALVTRWNYRDIARGLEPRNDVVFCMLEPDSLNVGACSYYKLQMKFTRVIGAINSPTTLDMYLRTGAFPFYTFSSTVNTMFTYVTTKHLNAGLLASAITPETERFPHNIELLPHLRPAPDDADALEALDLNNNLIDIEIDSSSNPLPSDSNNNNNNNNNTTAGANPMARFSGMMKEGFNTTQARLRELRDPVGMVQRGVAQMQVVSDAQRDEYLDEIEALGESTTRPVTANSIWMDLLAPQPAGVQSNVRRVDQELYADTSDVHHQGNIRSDMSVFEQYDDISRNNK